MFTTSSSSKKQYKNGRLKKIETIKSILKDMDL